MFEIVPSIEIVLLGLYFVLTGTCTCIPFIYKDSSVTLLHLIGFYMLVNVSLICLVPCSLFTGLCVTPLFPSIRCFT